MAPKRTLTSAAPSMTQAAIRKLVADSVAAALEAQAANMANTNNTNRNIEQREIHVARKCSYKEFISCQHFNFKGTNGIVGLIRWFERIESAFSCSTCTEDCKVKFATGTLTEKALSWWNSFALRIGIEEAYKITWSEFKKLLIKKSVEGNVTASKPQTLEEAITITQRLMDQVIKNNYVQGTNDHKRKFDDRRTFTNNNYQNNQNNYSNRNNDHHHQKNKRQETLRAYTATLTENSGKEKLYAKFSKFDLWISIVQFLGHKNKKYIWGENQESAFQLLKQKMGEAPILALPEENDDFVIYCDASHQGLEAVLMQREKVIAYASRQLKPYEENYTTHDLELGVPKLRQSKKRTSKLRTYKEWTKHLKYVLMEPDVSRIEVGYHSLSMQSDLGTQLDMSTAYHSQADGQSKRTIQTLKDMLRACVIDFGKGWKRHLPLVEFSYNNSYRASIKAAPFEALYGRKCRSPVCWAKVRDVQLTGPKIIHETTKKIVRI
nr:reverse transcriptase domain-containing protein [Tanacetum cinerariifolium]